MKKNKILVLSNDNTIVSPLKESYEVESASSRSDLLKKIEDRPGILAVIDCDIKDLKGFALYKEAKKLSPDSPIIMLSSSATIPEAVESAKLGVSDFIRKPVLAEKLLASVKQYLSADRSVEIKLRGGVGIEWLLGREPG